MTKEEKELKKRLSNLKIIHNRILSAISFKTIQSWKDVCKHLGYSDEFILKEKEPSEFNYKNVKIWLEAQLPTTEVAVKTEQPTTLPAPVTAQTLNPKEEKGVELSLSNLHEREAVYEPPTAKATISESNHKVEDKTEPALNKTAKDDYGYTRREIMLKRGIFPYWFQMKAAAQLKQKVVDEKKSGALLLSGTGTGKTYIMALFYEWLMAEHYADDKTMSPTPFLNVTKTTVVEQTNRVFKRAGIEPNVDVENINIEQLRSRAGSLWVRNNVKIVNGEEVEEWIWRKGMYPIVVGLDESQGTKNKGSTQSKILYSYNNIKENACLISISATPFTRVSEAQGFAVSTHRPLEHLGFPKGTVLTNDNWPVYASIIASPSKPEEYNQSAVERLMKDLDDWVVRVRGVKPQYDPINGVKIIQFESEADREYYNSAWERFCEEQAKLKAAEEAGVSTGTCHLVVLQRYSMAAEMCHARHFARRMYECVRKGKAAVCAVKWKGTLIRIVQILHDDYGVSRDEISLIWGGGQTQLNKKQKEKEKVKKLEDKLKALGMDMSEMLQDLQLDDVEERVIQEFPEHLRLGPQNLLERQAEIDNFQKGKSLYCIYTLKAGGVGLSLHHTDEFTTDWNRKHPGFNEWYSRMQQLTESQRPLPGKCRRKESGYAVEEDIQFIPVRERETFVVVTYNAIELVQGVGRVPRLTSLSRTTQNVYCYAGTIEVQMGRIYSAKLRCLSAVVKMHESWSDFIFGGAKTRHITNEQLDKEADKFVDSTKDVGDDESSLIEEGDTEDEEEDNT